MFDDAMFRFCDRVTVRVLATLMATLINSLPYSCRDRGRIPVISTSHGDNSLDRISNGNFNRVIVVTLTMTIVSVITTTTRFSSVSSGSASTA